jgi:hypothetical protein
VPAIFELAPVDKHVCGIAAGSVKLPDTAGIALTTINIRPVDHFSLLCDKLSRLPTE